MLQEELKKNQFKKKDFKKNQSQLVLTFETCDLDFELQINPIKDKP